MQMEALKAELDRAARVPALEAKIVSMQELMADKDKMYNNLSAAHIELATRAKKTDELATQERDLKVKMLELELKLEKEKGAAVERLATAAFRNPTVMKSFNLPVSVQGSGNCSGFVQNGTGSETTTTD